MDQYIGVEQILWFLLKYWHGCHPSCLYLKCCLIPFKIKDLFSLGPHWSGKNILSRNFTFTVHPVDLFFLSISYLYKLANDEFFIASTWQVNQSAFFTSFWWNKCWLPKTLCYYMRNTLFLPDETDFKQFLLFVSKWTVQLLQLSQSVW